MGRLAGLSQAQILELNDYPRSTAFTTGDRAVLAYADAMTNTPVDVSEAVFEPIRRMFSDEQIVELTSAIAWENYRARFNHALHIQSQNFAEGAYCALPDRV